MKHLAWLLILLSPLALGANTATVSWSAPTLYTDGTPITTALTYKVYQGLQGQARVLVSTVTTLSVAYSTGLNPGTTVCWDVTATAGGQESAHSVEACKTFPVQIPKAPTTISVQ